MTIPQGHLTAFFGPGLGLGLPLKGEGQQGHLEVVGLKAGLKATQGHPADFRGENATRQPPTPSANLGRYVGRYTKAWATCDTLAHYLLAASLWSFASLMRHTPQGTAKDSIKTPPRGRTGRRGAISESRLQCRVSDVACLAMVEGDLLAASTTTKIARNDGESSVYGVISSVANGDGGKQTPRRRGDRIALCVSRPFVMARKMAKARTELTGSSSSERKGRDGRVIDTSTIETIRKHSDLDGPAKWEPERGAGTDPIWNLRALTARDGHRDPKPRIRSIRRTEAAPAILRFLSVKSDRPARHAEKLKVSGVIASEAQTLAVPA